MPGMTVLRELMGKMPMLRGGHTTQGWLSLESLVIDIAQRSYPSFSFDHLPGTRLRYFSGMFHFVGSCVACSSVMKPKYRPRQ